MGLNIRQTKKGAEADGVQSGGRVVDHAHPTGTPAICEVLDKREARVDALLRA